MQKYFTATGTVTLKHHTSYGKTETYTSQFSHVVSASNAVIAEDKVIEYYCDKSTSSEDFQVDTISIFDFIE